MLTNFPVNAYIVTMTMWMPQFDRATGPVYQAIANALAEDISKGRLSSGQRLPTHRELARRLGVTIGTITRAYGEAERRGLVAATVGRGTFVNAPTGPMRKLAEVDAGIIDLRSNYPALAASASALSQILVSLAHDPGIADLLRYQDHAGLMRHRAAGAQLIARSGMALAPERILVTAGGQHAIVVALLTLAQPGDVVLTEELTYHNFKAAAQRLKLRLHGLPLDHEGLIPEALEEACRKLSPRVLYCTPTLQNPTAAIMSEARRMRIAEIAASHGVTILEDDILGFLAPEHRPLAAFASGPACYLSSVSKSFAPGLRLGFLAVPEGQGARFAEAIRMTCWMASPLAGEIVCRWIEDGTGERLIAAQREENAARIRIAGERLGPLMPQSHPAAAHLWLRLPAPWRADDFQKEAFSAGVALTAAEPFAVGVPAPEAIRICLGAAPSRPLLDKALAAIARLAQSPARSDEISSSIL
ncbi:MAG TPA: PLP-dependent aminotransferase family protein [Alphaproteobacteria bacterium]|nr:PLP-dependent aminotransferase family protein [Alphaproteobacteria bacterium]